MMTNEKHAEENCLRFQRGKWALETDLPQSLSSRLENLGSRLKKFNVPLFYSRQRSLIKRK